MDIAVAEGGVGGGSQSPVGSFPFSHGILLVDGGGANGDVGGVVGPGENGVAGGENGVGPGVS